MAKRRLLSLLLAATLITSSLPLTMAAAESDGEAAQLTFDAAEDFAVNGYEGAVTVVTPESPETYIHISGRDNSEDGSYYYDKLTTYDAAKTYTISFDIRTYDYIVSDDADLAAYPAVHRVMANGMWSTQLDGALKLTSAWVTKSYNVTNFNGTIFFRGDWHGRAVIPFDVKNLTIVEAGTTENLATNVYGLYTVENGAGWGIYQDPAGVIGKTFTVEPVTDSAYISIPAGETATSFTVNDDTVLEAGKYIITAELMAKGTIDFNKYTFDGTLAADGNIKTLTATAGTSTATGAVGAGDGNRTHVTSLEG